MPLHPAIVHVPVALAILLPLAIPLAAFLAWRQPGSRVPWIFVALMTLIMAGSSFVALETGEREEDVVEAVVPEPALEAHEDAAKVFMGLAAVLAGLGLASVVTSKTRFVLPIAAVAWMVSNAAAYQAYVTGEAGGELVYRYNAASAYAKGAAVRATAPSGDDDDD